MKTLWILIIIVAIAVSAISNFAYAQSSTVLLSMQKDVYYPNDVVVINGTTPSNQLVTVEIKNSFDKTVFEKSLLPSAKGQFSISYIVDNYPTKGTYVVIATQNSETVASYFGVYSKPSIRLEATMDKINYQNTDQPHITILDLPESVVDVKVLDNSQVQKFEDKIKTTPDGHATYDLSITSYSTGVYDLLVTSSTGKAKLGFAVGLMPSGPRMSLNTDKNSYLPGDNVTILGAWQSNTLVQLSLMDPSDISVKSIQTFSDKTGHFSSSNLTIPINAIPGIWQIGATSGVAHAQVQIAINSTLGNISGVKMDKSIIPSPLKQFKSGIKATDVKCKEDLQLIFKLEDNSPACVKQQTVQTLVKYGWGMWVPASIEQNTPILSNSVKVNNTDFTIRYNITGGNVEMANADISANALIMYVKTTGDGMLTVDLPRGLIDMQKNGHDDKFNIQADRQVINFEEINTTNTDRVLAIPFHVNIQQIEFIGNPIP